MKRSDLLITALLGLAATAPAVHADSMSVSPVSVRVEQLSADKLTKFDESQKKTLSIILNNAAPQDEKVKVKYYYFAKDVADHSVIVLSEGEKDALIKAHGTETVEAKPATAKSNERHAQTASRGRAGKEIPAAGKRLIGYGVQVMVDGKVATDYFSEPSLKSNVGGGDR